MNSKIKKRILIIGSVGQVGANLTPALRMRYGADNVVATGHHTMPNEDFRTAGPFAIVDATDKEALRYVVEKYEINTIYHLAAIMSAKGEQDPAQTWLVNVTSFQNVLELGVEYKMQGIFYPSSIAVFGETTPKDNAPQYTVLEPTTMYGVTKVVGENLGHYFFKKYGLDVRSLRYPGLITHKTFSGGGTSDYAVEIFIEALKHRRYTCYLRPDTIMPMMYMDDAIKATLALMEVEPECLTVRTSYNITALSFTVQELADQVGEAIPGFICDYSPDFRQSIADSWPNSIDDSTARCDWAWEPDYDIAGLTMIMIKELDKRL